MQITDFPIQYNVSLSSVTAHTYTVSLFIQSPHVDGQVLTLPAWIPGSYMIRDFAKHVINLYVTDCDNNSVRVSKTDKQTWQIAPSKGPILVTYQVYAFDLSVRGAYINDLYGFFNGSNLLLCVEDQQNRACLLAIQHPNHGFKRCEIATSMSFHSQQNDTSYFVADNYADLIDHPVLMGEFDRTHFKIADIDCELVLAGGHQCDPNRITQDLSQICLQHLQLFGQPTPVKRYVFLTLLTDAAFGGLEHRASTALMFARNDLPNQYEPTQPGDAYQNFLSLCSHEFFHTWHVKRIRPAELLGGSLASENYTEQLWIYEGFTSYYDDLLLQRSQIISLDSYLTLLGQHLTRLQRNKGRFKQTLAESSFDAWTKFYKQDESAINNIVSYYNKGAIVALCLDLAIRLTSDCRYSLDTVIQCLWQQFGQTGTPTPKTVIHDIIHQQLNLDLSPYFDLNQAVYTCEELPISGLLAAFGVQLNLRARTDINDKGGKPAKNMVKHDFGANFKSLSTGIEITQVSDNSAASQAGLMTGDQLIALNNWQVTGQNIYALIDSLTKSQSVNMFVLRDKRLVVLSFTATRAQFDTVYLELVDSKLVARWLTT